MVDIKMQVPRPFPSPTKSDSLGCVQPGIWDCNKCPGDSGEWPGLGTSAWDTASYSWRGFKGSP